MRKPMTWRRTVGLIHEDLRQRQMLTGRSFGFFKGLKLLFYPPAQAGAIFRLQSWLQARGWRRLAGLLRGMNIVFHSVDIGSKAEIGSGFILYHANGIVIGDEVQAGRNLHLAHQNSIVTGPRPGGDPARDRIVIEDDVMLGCGARIFGSLTVGHHTLIGANAVVVESVPPYSLLDAGGQVEADPSA
jgi:serine O-acetyltransferase